MMVETQFGNVLEKALEKKKNKEKIKNVIFDDWLNISYVSPGGSKVEGEVIKEYITDKNPLWTAKEWYVMLKTENNTVFAIKEDTLRSNETLKIFDNKMEKWWNYHKRDILRVLNENNQWEWIVEEVYDDGINFKTLSNKVFFVAKDSIQNVDISSLKKWDSVAFELPYKYLSSIERNKLNIKNINKHSLKDGIYEWVISWYVEEKIDGILYRWYDVVIGNVDGEQESFFVETKDMKTSGSAAVWNSISLDIKETDKWYDVKEVYLKEWSEFLLTPDNYRKILSWKDKDWLRIKVWYYSGVLYKNMIPQWFKDSDSIKLVVNSLKFAKRKTYKDITRKIIWFKTPIKWSLVKAKSEVKIHKWESFKVLKGTKNKDNNNNEKDGADIKRSIA